MVETDGEVRENPDVSASLPAAESYIRFQLDQMSARNEHHKFEDIAVRIARRRISSNILLATGPVSAGGDQKRDAESYYTRVPEELPHSTTTAAPASTNPIVIACTTQKDDLKGKVLADLKGVCSPDAAPVDHVTFFSIHPIPVATAHDLQKTARDDYSVSLDVFSGDQIATLLAEPDLIWVAVHYLELPSHMVPEPEDESSPDWYRALLDGLRATNGPAALTPGIQGEITRGMRFATFDSATNADLPEWLDFMQKFFGDTDDGNDTEIVFRACYEMSVARLRGIGSIAGVEDLFRRACSYALSVDTPAVLDDAATLVSYWGGAWSSGLATAEAAEITGVLVRLREHAAQTLEATDSAIYPIRAASLTATLAFMYMIPNFAKLAEKYGRPEPIATDPTAGTRHDPESIDTHSLADREEVDVAQAMDYLQKLAELLPDARAFPVETVAELFQFFAPAFLKHPDYMTVRDALDEATAAVQGESARAERCRDRAVALTEADEPLEALAELHDAKLAWFHGDTLHGAILVMRFIGQIYAGLGLMYAAKLYSCTAASLAVTNSDPDIKAQAATALLETMQHSQRAGCWLDAAAHGQVAVLARASLLPDPFDYDNHPELGHAEMNAAFELAAIREYWPALEEPFMKAFDPTGWDNLISEGADEVADAAKRSEAEFQALVSDHVAGPLLGDLGNSRLIDFRALGLRWMLTFNNDRATVLSAEAFCAALQVTLAEIARHEPVFLSGTVQIEVQVISDADESVHDCVIDNTGPEIVARVVLSDDAPDYLERSRALLTPVLVILHAVHVRPAEELQALLDPLFAGGLPNKIAIARPYEDAASLLTEEHYAVCAAAERPADSVEIDPVEPEALAPTTSLGTGYDRDESLQAIRERYETANESIPRTLARLAADDRYPAFIDALRAQGWLDWQILMAIWNLVGNWRLQNVRLSPTTVAPKQMRALFMSPDDEDSPGIPIDLILERDLTFFLNIQVMTVAQRWKLRPPTSKLAAEPIRELLARRYAYAEDDVPHVDLLECLDPDGNVRPFVEPSGSN